MVYVLTPTQDQITTALGNFIKSIVPAGTPITNQQVNRVPQVAAGNYVTMNVVGRGRLAVNIDSYVDAAFQGVFSGATVTASATVGELSAGLPLTGSGIADNTVLGVQQSGTPGGDGVYAVSPSQTLASVLVSAGTGALLQKTEVMVQVDTYGPNSADFIQMLTTMFRDPYGVDFFAAQEIDVAPLYADDPKQIPLTDAEQQWETRYTADFHMEANQVVSNIPQQFADQLSATLYDVDAIYPVQ